jgi:hypothetical protein
VVFGYFLPIDEKKFSFSPIEYMFESNLIILPYKSGGVHGNVIMGGFHLLPHAWQ